MGLSCCSEYFFNSYFKILVSFILPLNFEWSNCLNQLFIPSIDTSILNKQWSFGIIVEADFVSFVKIVPVNSIVRAVTEWPTGHLIQLALAQSAHFSVLVFVRIAIVDEPQWLVVRSILEMGPIAEWLVLGHPARAPKILFPFLKLNFLRLESGLQWECTLRVLVGTVSHSISW